MRRRTPSVNLHSPPLVIVCFCWCRVLKLGLTSDRLPLQDYDPDGEYIRHWIPELKNVPTSRIHEPWLMGKDEMVK